MTKQENKQYQHNKCRHLQERIDVVTAIELLEENKRAMLNSLTNRKSITGVSLRDLHDGLRVIQRVEERLMCRISSLHGSMSTL